jgi:hypothetical protein
MRLTVMMDEKIREMRRRSRDAFWLGVAVAAAVVAAWLCAAW